MKRVNTNKTAQVRVYVSSNLLELFGEDFFFGDYPLGKVKANANKTYQEEVYRGVYQDINCEYHYDRKNHIHSYWLAGNHDYSDYLFMGGHKA